VRGLWDAARTDLAGQDVAQALDEAGQVLLAGAGPVPGDFNPFHVSAPLLAAGRAYFLYGQVPASPDGALHALGQFVRCTTLDQAQPAELRLGSVQDVDLHRFCDDFLLSAECRADWALLPSHLKTHSDEVVQRLGEVVQKGLSGEVLAALRALPRAQRPSLQTLEQLRGVLELLIHDAPFIPTRAELEMWLHVEADATPSLDAPLRLAAEVLVSWRA